MIVLRSGGQRGWLGLTWLPPIILSSSAMSTANTPASSLFSMRSTPSHQARETILQSGEPSGQNNEQTATWCSHSLLSLPGKLGMGISISISLTAM